jgi:flagellin FlaB
MHHGGFLHTMMMALGTSSKTKRSKNPMFKPARLHNDESGITALETAIILIAFIVVASVFAFTILSAGTSSTERGQEAIYGGLEEVESSMEVKGAVVAESDGTSVTTITFTVGNVGGQPVDLTSDSASRVVIIGYRDEDDFVNNVDWTASWIVQNDTDDMLEEGELAEIAVDLSSATLTTALGTNTPFTLEIKPPQGAVLNLQRTTPAALDTVMELH